MTPETEKEIRSLLAEVGQLALESAEEIDRIHAAIPGLATLLAEARTGASRDATAAAVEASKLAAQAVAAVKLSRLNAEAEVSESIASQVDAAVREAVAEIEREHKHADGAPALDPCGTWKPGAYDVNAVVLRNGDSFLARAKCEKEDVPGRSSKWALLARGGRGGGQTIVAGGGGGGIGLAEVEAAGFIRGDVDGGNAIGGGDAFNP